MREFIPVFAFCLTFCYFKIFVPLNRETHIPSILYIFDWVSSTRRVLGCLEWEIFAASPYSLVAASYVSVFHAYASRVSRFLNNTRRVSALDTISVASTRYASAVVFSILLYDSFSFTHMCPSAGEGLCSCLFDFSFPRRLKFNIDWRVGRQWDWECMHFRWVCNFSIVASFFGFERHFVTFLCHWYCIYKLECFYIWGHDIGCNNYARI